MTLSEELIQRYQALMLRAIEWYDTIIEEGNQGIKFLVKRDDFSIFGELKDLVTKGKTIERKMHSDLLAFIIDEYENFLIKNRMLKLFKQSRIDEELLELRLLKDEF